MPFEMYNICTKRVDKNEKAHWPTVGTLFVRDDGFGIQLNMFPNEKFYCFKVDKEKKTPDNNPPF